MTYSRFYTPEIDISQINQQFTLNDKASHHIQVLRLKLNDKVILFDGIHGEVIAEIIELNKKTVTVLLLELFNLHRESTLNLNLMQCLASSDRMDFIIQKATELGVNQIHLFDSERSILKLDDTKRREKKLDHWREIILHAGQQCGRTKLPQLHDPIKINQFISKDFDKNNYHFLFLPSATQPFSEIVKQHQKELQTNQISLWIGPEGDFSPKEIEFLSKLENVFVVSLGQRILRTETAGMAVVSALHGLIGDF